MNFTELTDNGNGKLLAVVDGKTIISTDNGLRWNPGKQLQAKRKRVTKQCLDCPKILKDVYENAKRCKQCRNKNSYKNFKERKK